MLEHFAAVGIDETDVVEDDAAAMPLQRRGRGHVAESMRHEQGCDRFFEPRHVLGRIDQRDGEIARRMQNAEAQGTDEHDIAGRDQIVLPQQHRPSQQEGRERRRNDGVQQPQLLEIGEAAPPRRAFSIDGFIEPAMLEGEAAESTDQRQVGDHVDHLAIGHRGAIGEIAMKRRAARRETEEDDDHHCRHQDHRRGHLQTHRREKDD